MKDQERLRRQIGQRICAGFTGTEVTEEIRKLVREWKVGNILLYSRNVVSFPQLKQLCRDLDALIREETGQPALIMIDEESGAVSHLGHLAGETPSAGAIGATDRPEYARAIGALIGRRLRAVGIHMSLAPVLDCLLQPKNRVMSSRCFAREPEKVARFGCAYIEGLHEAGILTCGKHFPGHGDTVTDSHLALPTIGKSIEALKKTELVSFQSAIAAGTDAMMSAHILFPALDNLPATISAKILQGLLREELGFDGLILSDGMEMEAMLNLFLIPEGVLRALKAGVDIALVCHEPPQAAAACRRAMESVMAGDMKEDTIEAHDRRIREVKSRLRPATGSEADFLNPEGRKLSSQIMTEVVQLIHRPGGNALPEVTEKTGFFGCVSRRRSPVEGEKNMNAAEMSAAHFGARLISPEETELPADMETLVGFLEIGDETERNLRRIRRWAKEGKKIIAVALDTPAVLSECPETVWKITGWQYQKLAVETVIRLLQNR